MHSSDHTFDAHGVKLHYIVEGQGEPVVLLHGLTSSALLNWQRPGTVALLARNYQVIALDSRGHGASEKPDNPDAYGVELAEDVLRLMDHLQIKKAHIVGYSMGGMIALKFIVKHPDRVLSGLLCGMGWLREGGFLAKTWVFIPGVCASTLGKLAVSESEIKAVKAPMSVLIGDKDPVGPLYVGPLQAARNDWPVVKISGADHFSCVVKPQFKDEIQKWIAQQSKK